MGPKEFIFGGKRRDRTRVIRDILEKAQEGSSITSLIYGVNLNHYICKKYINFLIKRDLLAIEDGLYKTTRKGREFLYFHKMLEKALYGEASTRALIR